MHNLPIRILCASLAAATLALSLTGCGTKTPAAGSSIEASSQITAAVSGANSQPGNGADGQTDSSKAASVKGKTSSTAKSSASSGGTSSKKGQDTDTGKTAESKPDSQKPASSSPASQKTSSHTPSEEEPDEEPALSPDQLDRKKILTPNLWGKQGNVLILGNSFINSSQVGDTLERLTQENGQRLTVNAVSEGFATIESLSNHINSDPGIRAGKYDAIFLCGIFSPETQALQRFLNAVKGTKTKIILFPASNESPSDIAAARDRYPGSGYLGWLDIIYELYANEGFSRTQLTNNDWVLHLNEIGGYAGAQLIFHYLYRKTPASSQTDSYIASNYGSAIFGGANNAKKRLSTIAKVANELVLGKRPYEGAATV